MPTWRKLHQKTTESLDINELPDDFTRLLWILLPLGLDREGRGLDNPSWIKAKIVPLRTDVTLDQIIAAVDCFAERGMLLRYQIDGRRYFAIPTWHKYQGDTSREAGSPFPPPPANDIPDRQTSQISPAVSAPGDRTPISRPAHDQLASNSGAAQDLLATNSRLDTDSDSDLDSEADVDSDSPAPPNQTVSPDLRVCENPDPFLIFRQTYDLARLTPAQERTLRGLIETYSAQLVTEAIAWASGAGIPLARALRAIGTALPGWRTRPSSSTPPHRTNPIDELLAELEQDPKEVNRGRPPRASNSP